VIYSFLFYICPILLLVPGRAQSTQHGGSGQTVSLKGSVTDSLTHVPIPDVEVSVHGPKGDLDTTTDARGAFSLNEIVVGRYRINLAKDGYARADPKHSKRVIVSGLADPSVSFSMDKEAVIAGRVFTSKHAPAAGQRLSLWEQVAEGGTDSLRFRGYAVTDDLGDYRIASLSAGAYYLATSPPPLPLTVPAPKTAPSPDTAAVTTFYPNAVSLEAAQEIAIKTGEQREDVDVIAQEANAYCITARIPRRPTDSSELPFMALTLAQRTRGLEIVLATSRVQMLGSVEICHAPPGAYILAGVTPWGSLLHADVYVARRNLDLGVLPESPGAPVHGQIVIEHRQDEPSLPASITIQLQPVDRLLYSSERATATVSTSGAFTLPYVFPGKFWLTMRGAPKGYYMTRVEAGGIDCSRQPLTVGPDTAVRVSVGTDAASLQGRIVDGHDVPVNQVRLVFAPRNLSPPLSPRAIMSVEPDQNGTYLLQNIPPGDYQLLVVPLAAANQCESLLYLNQHRSEARELTLGSSQSMTLDLHVAEIDQ
jgi:Carboxypeptidase regulatory-like domain